MFSVVLVVMMLRNERGVESNNAREDFARTLFISSSDQPIALKDEEDDEKAEARA